jgi:hypothetical protein
MAENDAKWNILCDLLDQYRNTVESKVIRLNNEYRIYYPVLDYKLIIKIEDNYIRVKIGTELKELSLDTEISYLKLEMISMVQRYRMKYLEKLI